MAADHLTAEARQENATSLAAILGQTSQAAVSILDLAIVVTADPMDPVAQHIAAETCELLMRTVRQATQTLLEIPSAAELVIGAAHPRTAGPYIFLEVNRGSAVIQGNASAYAVCEPIPKLFGLIIACYASAASLYKATGGIFPYGVPDPFNLSFDQLGDDQDHLGEPIDLGHAYLAGAGAIGNGFLWAARYLQIKGRLDIVDDDEVSSGNLNRQIWFDANDINEPKAQRLASKAQPWFPTLALAPRFYRVQDLPEKSDGPWLRRLIVAVDSRRARRELQNEFPCEVFDASTTDIREIVLHYHRQPTNAACLGCIYQSDAEEFSREQHISEHLGVTIEEVRSQRISAETAQRISNRYPSLDPAHLVGTAYDSLFKRLCAEGLLGKLEDKRVLAPFAFVSVLAGSLLALEVVRRLGSTGISRNFNYWRISPWHPPLSRRQVVRPRQAGCSFCGDHLKATVNTSLWR